MNLFFVGLVASTFGSSGHARNPETTPFPPALTSFTCHGREPGYYADLETGCKAYHVCDGNSHFTYLCPKRTLFQQRSRICDHSYLVNCQDSPYFYETDDDAGETFTRLRESETSKGNDLNQTKESVPTTEPTSEGPVETQTTVLATPTASTSKQTINTEPATVILKGHPTDSLEKFLKFRLKDFRSLFFIPEFDNNSVVAKPERELILPVEENDLMKFTNRKEVSRLPSLCPAYCNPKFFVSGTCHPCIMIK